MGADQAADGWLYGYAYLMTELLEATIPGMQYGVPA